MFECQDQEHKTAESVLKMQIRKLKKKFILVRELSNICVDNSDYYKSDKSLIGSCFLASFNGLKENLEKSLVLINIIGNFSHEYDFDENTKGNGYQSFVHIYHAAVNYSLKIAKYITDNRGSLLFRKNLYLKEIEVCNQIFGSLFIICENLIEMHKESDYGELFAKDNSQDYITDISKNLSTSHFYGTALAFQYCKSIQICIKALVFSITTYSEAFYNSGNYLMIALRVIFKLIEHLFNCEVRGERMTQITRHSSVKFYKTFVNFMEGYMIKYVPAIFGVKVEVNELFSISSEPIKLFSETEEKFIDIVMPCDFGGVKIHLLSAKRRSGMMGEKSSISKKPSKYLLIHVQGSGWIMQSSKSHELYLREWAVQLDIPIITIHYSLAPESPFPQAVNEIFYVYCWALKNCGLLGSTGENIVMAGDSSGGPLNIACAMKCIEMGIRKPRALFNAYCPFIMNPKSTPSVFFSLFDAIVPYHILLRCYIAYMPKYKNNDDQELKDASSNIPPSPENEFINIDYDCKNPLLAPYWASDEILKQLPSTTIITTNYDICLDDCVMFSKKLKKLGVQTELTIFDGLLHGFFNFSTHSNEAREATTICMYKIAKLLGMNLN